MKELKFIKVLSYLPRAELNRLTRFLESPYCNSNPLLITLYNELFSEQAGLKEEGIDKLKLWKKLAPSKSFNDAKWRKLCNDLLNAIQRFLTYEQLNKRPLLADNLLLESIYENNLATLYKSLLAKVENDFIKNNSLSSEYHLQHFLLERNLYNLKEFEINMETQSNLESIHHNLDLFYIAEKTKQLVNAATRRLDFNLPIDINLEEELMDMIQKNDYLHHPEINLYYKIYQIKKTKNAGGAYGELKKSVLDHLDKFSQQEAVDIFKEMINFTTLQRNQGQTEFETESLEWYKYGLKHDLVFPKNKFQPGHFLNIVITGIRTKEFAWTERFIEEYQQIIPADQKHTLVTFSLARLYFNQKAFDQVIEKLRDVEFGELTYNLDSKVLLLATYYEVEEWQAMTSLADSFRTFLNRHQKDITLAKKLRYSNFIKFIKRLSRVKYQDKAAIARTLNEIKSTEGLVNQAWLLEKARSLN